MFWICIFDFWITELQKVSTTFQWWIIWCVFICCRFSLGFTLLNLFAAYISLFIGFGNFGISIYIDIVFCYCFFISLLRNPIFHSLDVNDTANILDKVRAVLLVRLDSGAAYTADDPWLMWRRTVRPAILAHETEEEARGPRKPFSAGVSGGPRRPNRPCPVCLWKMILSRFFMQMFKDSYQV